MTQRDQTTPVGAKGRIIRYALAIGILEYFAYKVLDPYYLQFMTTPAGLNLNPIEFGWFVSLASAVTFGTNYLTGVFSDKIGRRLSWAMSMFLYGGGMAWLGFQVDSFSLAIPTAFLMGGSYAFYTGSPQAWLYQEVGEGGMRQAFGRLYLYAVPLSTAAVIAAVALSVENSLRLPVLFVGAIVMLDGLFILSFPENYGTRQKPWRGVVKDGIKQFLASRVLMLTALQSFFMTLPSWINSAWWFTYLVTYYHTNLAESALGFGVSAIAATIAGMYITKMKTTDYRKLIIYPTILAAVAYLAIPFEQSIVLLLASISVTITATYFRGSGITILENEQITTTNRASVLSFLGTLRSGFWAVGPLIWGVIIQEAGLKNSFLIAGIFCLISLAIMLLAIQVARRDVQRQS